VGRVVGGLVDVSRCYAAYSHYLDA